MQLSLRSGFLILFLFFGLSVYAQPEQSVSSKNWNKILDSVQKTGKLLESPYGDYLYVEHIEPADTAKPHVANYFSLVGGYDINGVFQYAHIEVVSENWQISGDGNWQIDQYLYRITTGGQIQTSSHVDMIQTKDRVVLKHEIMNFDEAAAKSNWQRILNNWYVQIGLD
ncbi:MAG: hypothetical protein JNM24_13905 [Bdellovibrionaceae bacterium]|nr:hypothetical protein [Pseudobdellovibrionaceae bacterium]